MKDVVGLMCLPLLAIAFLLAAPQAFARYPPLEPALRVNEEMHSTDFKVDVNIPYRLLATASMDKTLRLWNLETGDLIRVIRGPIDVGYEGRLIAVAISPDGRTVAVGGNTGSKWDRSNSVYLYDVESGRMTRRYGEKTLRSGVSFPTCY
ncbi:MAG: hypothetical protein AAGI44_02010 [Pseudomonadota bacterium]